MTRVLLLSRKIAVSPLRPEETSVLFEVYDDFAVVTGAWALYALADLLCFCKDVTTISVLPSSRSISVDFSEQDSAEIIRRVSAVSELSR